MSTFECLAQLELQVDGYRLEGLRLPATGFDRRTTVVRLFGGGVEGFGEDVNYEAAEQLEFQQAGSRLPLDGRSTLREFSERLASLSLFTRPPRHAASVDYRRWAFESAALDLALRQAGTSLHQALQLEPRPVRYLVSCGLGRPPSAAALRSRLARYPELTFKLDAASDWTPELISTLGKLAPVAIVDFKGAYRGTPVDGAPDPVLYRRVAEGFPEAWLEDPALTAETRAVLADHVARVTWDAPIHGVADVEALPVEPRALNVKPSRAGSLERVLDVYDYCLTRGISMYGGGQFELGVGRAQIQYLASLFHPDAPNDVAPTGFHDPAPPPGLPRSPLAARPAATGFGWRVSA